MTRATWNWGSRDEEHAAGPVCVARVLTLVTSVEVKLRDISPKFVWPEGHDLFVAIKAEGDDDAVLGYALTVAGAITKIVTAQKDAALRKKLRAEALAPRQRPFEFHASQLYGMNLGNDRHG